MVSNILQRPYSISERGSSATETLLADYLHLFFVFLMVIARINGVDKSTIRMSYDISELPP
jgi:hypothetical protein